MNPRDSDHEIRRLFEAASLADETAAPDLDDLLARPVPHTGARSLGRIVRAASAIAAVVAMAFVFHAASSRRPAAASPDLPPAAVQLASWTSTTDSLLQTPGSDLWTSVPDLAPAISVTGFEVPLETTKGVER